jgi:predicted Zn-ribbon and HTH transcriptional regulator
MNDERAFNKVKGLKRLRETGAERYKMVAARPRCKKCGYRIRGKNHKEGLHHVRGTA